MTAFARFRGEVNDRYVATFEGMPSRIAGRAADFATDTYWDAVGGPWIARYRRSAILASIGIGKDVEKHFHDPHEALAYFDSLGRRHRRNRVLRGSCLVTYKDDMGGGGGWYAVEPFAADAVDALEVMIREIARDEGRAVVAGSEDSPRRIGGRKKPRRSSSGWADAIAWQWAHPDSSGLGDGIDLG